MRIFESYIEEIAEKRIGQVSIVMQISEPFFGSLLSRIKKIYTRKINGIGIAFDEGKARLIINPYSVCMHTTKDVYSVCKHILLHICAGHLRKFPGIITIAQSS